MKTYSFLTVALIMLFITTSHASSQVVIPEPNFNFGTIVQGEKLSHTFAIKNNGDSPISILRVTPSCGCTVANASSSVIQPGKSGEIKIVFDSANSSGKTAKSINVETNDHKNPSSTLTIIGTIIEEIQITPRQVSLGQVKAGSSVRSNVTLTNRGERPLKLISAKAQIPQITAEIKKQQLKKGEASAIEITVATKATDKVISGYLIVTTDSPRKSEIIIPIYGSLIK